MTSASDEEEERSCCSAAGDEAAPHCGGCAQHNVAPLAALPEDATDKERWLRKIQEDINVSAHYALSPVLLETFRKQLDAAAEDPDPSKRLLLRMRLATYLMFHGSTEQSIEEFEACVELQQAHPDRTEVWVQRDVVYRLGLAHFRLGEQRNCIAHHNQESCIFPLRGGAVHVEPAGAEATTPVMRSLLEADVNNHEARWVLNMAHMALGNYPDVVPKQYRYSPETFASEIDPGRFLDVARTRDLGRFSRAGTVLFADLNGDGYLDVLTCSFDTGTPLPLSLGDEHGDIVDATAAAGLTHRSGGTNMIQGDVDNDGLLDVLVLRGGELAQAGEIPCSLLRQVRPGRFEDMTAAAGVEIAASSRSADFADIDGDGDMDLFIGYEAQRTADGARYPSRLYLGDGQGVFEDVTKASGVAADGWCVGVAFGDVDGEGDSDLYLAHFSQPNALYLNDGYGGFTDATARSSLAEPLLASGSLFFDFDYDGDLDLSVPIHGHDQSNRRPARSIQNDGCLES
ncbi:MAG: hypothetical protein ACI835_004291 [Planctomycetota bacterium]|jgi:hypothetical protein